MPGVADGGPADDVGEHLIVVRQDMNGRQLNPVAAKLGSIPLRFADRNSDTSRHVRTSP